MPILDFSQNHQVETSSVRFEYCDFQQGQTRRNFDKIVEKHPDCRQIYFPRNQKADKISRYQVFSNGTTIANNC